MKTRLFIERQKAYQIESKTLSDEINHSLGFEVTNLRSFIIYDIEGLTSKEIDETLYKVFAEINKDVVYKDLTINTPYIAYEYLPGQYDQRADSALQCVELLLSNDNVTIKTGTLILFEEGISHATVQSIKAFLINKVEAREKDLNDFSFPKASKPKKVGFIEGFIDFSLESLKAYHEDEGFAMTLDDLVFIQAYFTKKKRNPTETELKVLDTYWSDHCRHTTFETVLEDITIEAQVNMVLEEALHAYDELRIFLNRVHTPKTLMDLATINARYETARGTLRNVEVSSEHNAASIVIDVDVDGVFEPWLLMFKNETHNHPTEIEPFGGASTCIGGAIRDPLSGRSYVYSATRITGAGDITEPVERTLKGKLPQRVISKRAAEGYASYGNQIGLATTFVEERYHPGYKAKRMEVGAVVGAAPLRHVRREAPRPGDLVLVIGGRTGRDGIGGATGSSKTQNKASIVASAAEVQKGNAVTERKIQRLFRNPLFTKHVKKANDFGAGGVSVAIGELADGLHIELDKLPVKYLGLNATELAISESQERMAVVIDKDALQSVEALCKEENIDVSTVAHVTKEARLLMMHHGDVVCDIERSFIDTSGVKSTQKVILTKDRWDGVFETVYPGQTLKEKTHALLEDLNIASQQGMVEMFDSTIGTTTVIMPYGGKTQKTKAQASVHKLPVGNHFTDTVSIMAYGFDPYLSELNPYLGASYAVVESVAKTVASGGSYHNIRFTFQEYFERLGRDAKTWGKPLKALLGASHTLKAFGLAAIGGKDSMSGSFETIHVPPTLISFAVSNGSASDIISNAYLERGSYLYLAKHHPLKENTPNVSQLKALYDSVNELIKTKDVISAYALSFGGLIEALIKASFGNLIGIDVQTEMDLFTKDYGSLLIESKKEIKHEDFIYLGRTTDSEVLTINTMSLSILEAIKVNEGKFEPVYPVYHIDKRLIETMKVEPVKKEDVTYKANKEEVNVLLPIFPGTNCEYDSERAFVNSGAQVTPFVFNNQTKSAIQDSIERLARHIEATDIVMISGGFSSGDEPDGSGKFIANVLRHARIKQAIDDLRERKGLILGICNGFQALIKSGLLPYGDIVAIEETSPSLYKNLINRHSSKFIRTKTSSSNGPWLKGLKDKVHAVPISHTEGRFVVNEKMLKELIAHNQVAFQYVDESDNPTYNPRFNPNGSTYAIEGIVSRDGLILGKMAHSERLDKDLYKNIVDHEIQPLFENAVAYIKQRSQKL